MIAIKITEQPHVVETKVEAISLDKAFAMLVEKGMLDLNRVSKMVNTHKSTKNST